MDRKSCFFLAPIGPEGSEVNRRYNIVLRHLVASAAPAAGYDLIRVDPLGGTSYITADVLRRILNADVVVADVSGRDPNVLYSLGIPSELGMLQGTR